LARAIADGRFFIGRGGAPCLKYYGAQDGGVTPSNWWPVTELRGENTSARKTLHKLLPDAPSFATPKPEELIHRILTIATNPGDIVLDAFAGAGSTGATAHKMGRRWIMIEQGEQCETHIIPRMTHVIDGTDPYGITATVGWSGGGGYDTYRVRRAHHG
jgi:adenine-specific DNA-methyltransferase